MSQSTSDELIERLARLRGIGEAYHDYRGELRYFSLATKTEILRAMGSAVDDVDAMEQEFQALQSAPPAPASQPTPLTPGSKPHCFEPLLLARGQRGWGITAQLYSLRSNGNWGIGDFADLQDLLRATASAGGAFVGVNPLHALFPSQASHCSPYGASSRHFLNVLYIAVPRVAEFASSEPAQRLLASPAFVARLAQARATPRVHYPAVGALKLGVLKLLYAEFRLKHWAAATPRAVAFQAFIADGGERLRQHALFDALDASFARPDLGPGWLSWPAAYRDPHSAAVQTFAAANEEWVGFYLYLQWLACEQLLAAQALARELKMAIGLYGDFAVGANAAGSETWSDQQTYRLGAGIGAPPDSLALRGQDWGIPPQDPRSLLRQQLEPFLALIRNNVRFYGALRLDHVMALFRQWWVPRGMEASDGGYVHYPLQQLLTVLAQESQRSACLIIGEDLGTVPNEMREAMPRFAVYHYKVLLFEKEHDGQFLAPERYVRAALATLTTHDLPPLRSWWEGSDIELRAGLGLYPDGSAQQAVAEQRTQDRAALLRTLWIYGLAPDAPTSADGAFTLELARKLHEYLAQSTAALVGLQLEDLIGMNEPVNVPGTSEEYANWQRKITLTTEDIFARSDVLQTLAAVAIRRG